MHNYIHVLSIGRASLSRARWARERVSPTTVLLWSSCGLAENKIHPGYFWMNIWHSELQSVLKLRTFSTFKSDYKKRITYVIIWTYPNFTVYTCSIEVWRASYKNRNGVVGEGEELNSKLYILLFYVLQKPFKTNFTIRTELSLVLHYLTCQTRIALVYILLTFSDKRTNS